MSTRQWNRWPPLQQRDESRPMIFQETSLPGAFVIDLDPKHDERGFFARLWTGEDLVAHGLNPRAGQVSLSYNRSRGTLRGMHYRAAPHAESKLVRCIRGAIYDVIVDVRPSSPTHLHWLGVTLSAENRKSLYVPEGFAHGFQTLEDDTEVLYLLSATYMPAAERGLRWDDGALGITWPEVDTRVISERDRNWPLYTATEHEPSPATRL